MNQNIKKKFCVIVLCFYKLRKKKQKKTAKTTTNVVLKEGDCGEVVDYLLTFLSLFRLRCFKRERSL